MYVAPRFYLLIAVANLKITDCFETPGIFCFKPCLLLFCRPATLPGQGPSAYYLFMSIYGHLFAEKGLWIPDYLLTCLMCIMDNANRAMSIDSTARTSQSINVNVSVLMVIGIFHYDNANHHRKAYINVYTLGSASCAINWHCSPCADLRLHLTADP